MTRWLSEVRGCDFCKTDLKKCEYFVDGKTVYGPWALMCPSCYHSKGCGIGYGVGQKYDAKPPHELLEGGRS